MVTVLALLGVVLVLFVAAVLSTREGPLMAEAPQDVADVVLPEGLLLPEDLAGVRFGLAPRGYRMSEVDAVLERLAAELADRDRRLALLVATVEGDSAVLEAGEDDLPVAAVTVAQDQVAVAEANPVPVPPGAVSLFEAEPIAGPPLSVAQVPLEPAPLPEAAEPEPAESDTESEPVPFPLLPPPAPEPAAPEAPPVVPLPPVHVPDATAGADPLRPRD